MNKQGLEGGGKGVKGGVAEIMIHMAAGLGIPTIPVMMGLTWRKTMSSCQSLGSKGHMDP